MTPPPDIDYQQPGFGTFYDELPLWSAPFGMMLLERVPLRPDLTVLDVGAGTGFLTLELAQRCGAQSRVIAVDPWQAGAQRLREKREFLGLDNVEIIEADAADVELPEASIDLIVSNLGLNNFPNAEAVLKRCFALAKPGATLALATNLDGHMREVYDVYRDVLAETGTDAERAALEAHERHRGTAASVRARIERAGFHMVDIATDVFAMRFADGSALLRHFLIRLGFLPDWKAVVGPERAAVVLDELESRLNAFAAERHGLSLTIPMAYLEARKPD